MTRMFKRLRRDQRGAGALEFALAIPILTMLIYGIFTIGMLYRANAGMQHALGEAARYATIFPTPTDAQIKARAASKAFGTSHGTLGQLAITNENSGGSGTQYKVLSLTYSQPTNFLFFRGPNVSITRSKRVYIPL